MTTEGSSKKYPTIGILLLGFPIVLACGVVLAFLLHFLGVHQPSDGPSVVSLISIIVGVSVLNIFQDRFRTPSRRLLIAAIVSYVFVALVLWARLTNRIPPPS